MIVWIHYVGAGICLGLWAYLCLSLLAACAITRTKQQSVASQIESAHHTRNIGLRNVLRQIESIDQIRNLQAEAQLSFLQLLSGPNPEHP